MDFEDKLEKTYAAIGGQVKKFGFGDMMSQKLAVVGEGEEFLLLRDEGATAAITTTAG